MTSLRHGVRGRIAENPGAAPAIIAFLARALLVSAAVAAAASAPMASARAETTDGSSSHAARNEAVRAIPWRELTPDSRRAAQFVVKNASIYRRLPTRIIDCDPDMFNFLFQHPEVVIDVWRVMGISQVTIAKMPAGTRFGGSAYRGTDGAGTNGVIRVLFTQWGEDGQNVAVVFADGSYHGKPFAAELKAQSLLFVRWSAIQETNGRYYVTVRVDSFVRLDQIGVELVAKTVQPWIAKTADRNFIETLTFVSNFSRTAEKNPQGMQRLANRLASLDEPTRNELVALCFRTAERYAMREQAARPAGPLLAKRDLVAGRDER